MTLDEWVCDRLNQSMKICIEVLEERRDALHISVSFSHKNMALLVLQLK